MENVLLASLRFAGVDRYRSARINEYDAAPVDRLSPELGLLLVHRCPAKIGNPVVEKIVRLGFQSIGSDRHDRVG